jgi:hypothetical protein
VSESEVQDYGNEYEEGNDTESEKFDKDIEGKSNGTFKEGDELENSAIKIPSKINVNNL